MIFFLFAERKRYPKKPASSTLILIWIYRQSILRKLRYTSRLSQPMWTYYLYPKIDRFATNCDHLKVSMSAKKS